MSDLYNRDIVTWSEQQAALAPVRGPCSQSGRRDTGRREAAPKPRAGSRGAEKTNVLAGGVRQCNARPAAVPLRGRRRTRAFRRRM